MKKRIIFIILAVLAIAGGGYGAYANRPQVVEKPVVVEQKTQPIVISKPAPPPVPDAKEIIKLTNDYRATKGLAPLVESELLNKSACLKADDMIAKDYWAHVSPDGIQPWYWFEQAGYRYRAAGENLSRGYMYSNEIVREWVKSPTHEANLSGNYSEVGVCVLTHVRLEHSASTDIAVAHYATP